MLTYQHLASAEQVAARAANHTIQQLKTAIGEHGSARWVLAGGSSPVVAYREIVSRYSDALDWSKVAIMIGDERLVPWDHADSNWGQLVPILMSNPSISRLTKIAPDTSLEVRAAAADYARRIIDNARPDEVRLDVVWLGVGEDGHTLSLFPAQEPVWHADALVTSVPDSPKPPAERITLTLAALDTARMILVFATGAGKRAAQQRARAERRLPIAVASDRASASGAEVIWLYDPDAGE